MSQNNLPVKKIKYPVANQSFDLAYYETDEYFQEIVAELESVYGQAYVELKEIAEEYLQHFIDEDKAKREQFQNGVIDAYEYNRWRENAMMTGRYHYAMLQNAADNLANKNALAISIINGYMPSVYATNGNYIFYEVEKKFGVNASFTIFNEEAVERIIREKPDLIPRKANLNIPKDKQWNKQNINSAIMQGIIQGETIDALAERLASVADMNYSSAVRNATTMICSAQNGGRMDSYRRCQDMGIKLKHRWLATLDGHTRMSHRALDGEVRAVDEEFSNGLLFPGDPSGEPREVYNCRCCTIPAFEDSEFSGDKDRASRLPSDMSYDDWKNAKGVEPFFKAAQNVNADMRMHDEYLNLYKNYKGSFTNAVPKNFRDFQDLKYNDPAAWKQMVSGARKARNQARKSKENLTFYSINGKIKTKEKQSDFKPIAAEHSIESDLAKTNPKYFTGDVKYMRNCQKCVCTYEARRRGYNVTARPITSMNENIATLDLKKGFPSVFKNPEIIDIKGITRGKVKSNIKNKMEEWGNGARAIVSVYWAESGDGHVFMAEQIDRKTLFVDPQTNDSDVSRYFSEIKTSIFGRSYTSIIRTDNLEFTENIEKCFIELKEDK